jgi:hypothetical protein
VLYDIEVSLRSRASDTLSEFEQRKDEWNRNKFGSLVAAAKKDLDPLTPPDFGTLYEDFHRDQAIFTQWARKLLQSGTLIAPPDHLKSADLEQWWREVEEILTVHSAFVSKFQTSFQRIVADKLSANQKLISEIESELSDLADESEASDAFCELAPLQRQSQHMLTVFIERLQKYWTSRTDSFRKAFESLRAVLEGLIANYATLDTELAAVTARNDASKQELREASLARIAELEAQLAERVSEIPSLVGDRDIAQRDRGGVPPVPRADVCAARRAPVGRCARVRRGRAADARAAEADEGGRDRGRDARARVRREVRGLRRARGHPDIRRLRRPAPARGARGKDDFEDGELPDVPLIDAVPKIAGEVSGWVYVPVSEEASEWLSALRADVLEAF